MNDKQKLILQVLVDGTTYIAGILLFGGIAHHSLFFIALLFEELSCLINGISGIVFKTAVVQMGTMSRGKDIPYKLSNRSLISKLFNIKFRSSLIGAGTIVEGKYAKDVALVSFFIFFLLLVLFCLQYFFHIFS
jgi:hypothetical protein